MAAKKTAKKFAKTKKTSSAAVRVKKTISSKKQKSTKENLFTNLRFSESYTSLVLGIIAVIIVTVFLLFFFGNRQASKVDVNATPTIVDIEELDITITPTPYQAQPKVGKTYTVAVGDTLWSIAEKAYGSGYNWIDIARANNLANPNQIFAGNKLLIPSIKLKDATVLTGENEAQVSRTVRIADETYMVVKGDDLWNIAVRSYGDGYQWTKIAKANNLTNPGLIHSGNILKIPRN